MKQNRPSDARSDPKSETQSWNLPEVSNTRSNQGSKPSSQASGSVQPSQAVCESSESGQPAKQDFVAQIMRYRCCQTGKGFNFKTFHDKSNVRTYVGECSRISQTKSDARSDPKPETQCLKLTRNIEYARQPTTSTAHDTCGTTLIYIYIYINI